MLSIYSLPLCSPNGDIYQLMPRLLTTQQTWSGSSPTTVPDNNKTNARLNLAF